MEVRDAPAVTEKRDPLMPYVAVTALSHTGLIRDHNEDSLVVGPWTLCGTVTENPQTLLFPLGAPLVVAVADGIGGRSRAARWPVRWSSGNSLRSALRWTARKPFVTL